MTALERLRALGAARDAVLARLVPALRADPRVVAAWLEGSFAAGTADDWSDLDLYVVVRDEDFAQVVEHRMDLYRLAGEPALEMQLIRQGPSFFVILLYPGGVEIDWSLLALKDARRPASARLLFDEVGVPVEPAAPLPPDGVATRASRWVEFFWAMAAIGVKNAGRGHTHWAAHSFDQCVYCFDGLWRLTADPGGPDVTEVAVRHRAPMPEVGARVPDLGASIDATAMLDAFHRLCAEMEALHPRVAALGGTVPTGAPAAVAELADLARSVVGEGR